MLSGYRLMWMMVMYDLPVVEEKARKIAAKFRKYMEKEGFSMVQFSVYAKFCGTREQAETLKDRVGENLPEKGKVSILMFTDKQFGDIVHLTNRKRTKAKENPDQLVLFSEADMADLDNT
jgi:CRISPR-associated protein Cas2